MNCLSEFPNPFLITLYGVLLFDTIDTHVDT